MINVIEHISVLGHRVQDSVTGFKGVATSVSFDLYGCIQILVNPGMDKDGKLQDQTWFDSNRLEVLPDGPVMERPQFEYTPENIAAGDKGPAEKPANKP